ncbi:MAG: hypothetical protein K2Y01_01210 [Rhabdochlamydiaceae bacterium]|nr:hypothetical protein [Rhabdochlamydiaceae bacterium]
MTTQITPYNNNYSFVDLFPLDDEEENHSDVCRSIPGLDTISSEEFFHPPTIIQRSLDGSAAIQMKDKSFKILENTKAIDIYDYMIGRSQNEPLEHNALTVLVRSDHVSIKLNCGSCNDGIPYYEHFGFWPPPNLLLGSGQVKKEAFRKTNDNNSITIYLSDEQAQAVFDKKTSMKKNPPAYGYQMNCIDFADQIYYAATKEHFINHFPEEQSRIDLNNILNKIPMHYAALKYKYNVPISLGIPTTLFTAQVGIFNLTIISWKIAKTCISVISRLIFQKPIAVNINSHYFNEANSFYLKISLASIATQLAILGGETLWEKDSPSDLVAKIAGSVFALMTIYTEPNRNSILARLYLALTATNIIAFSTEFLLEQTILSHTINAVALGTLISLLLMQQTP